MNRYLSAIIILAALTGNNGLQAQSLKPAPRLVVNIIIDQLRSGKIYFLASRPSLGNRIYKHGQHTSV